MSTRALAVFGVCAALLLAACDNKAAFNNVDITGAKYAREFSLTDHTGARRALADYRGKVVTVFFGFAQCPDVCPTTLQDMAAVKQKLGRDGDKLQVLFITVDPERDTQDVLAKYMAAFDPSFVALRGTAEETSKVAKEFKIIFEKVAGQTPTSYTINHSAGTYVFDREGRVRLFVKHAAGVDAIAADLKRLL
jgi:protein SCO1/2